MKISFQTYRYLILFCIICITRTLMYLSYAEDIDSLRFALSVIDEFDITKNQPHFPAYPIFVFLVKSFYLVVQNAGISFAIVGSIGVFLVAYSLIEINRLYYWIKEEWLYSLTLIVSPLIFLLSTRYMADALGLGMVSLSCLFFLKTTRNRSFEKHFFITIILLAGIRLSFVPLFVIPSLVVFYQSNRKIENLLIGLITLALWMFPLIIITGWNELINVAIFGTNGHFNEWGGSVKTDPHYGLRLLRMFQFILTDGLGLWWFDRSPILIPSTLIFFITCIKGFKTQFSKEIQYLFIGFIVYAFWAYFFQNVLYKPRHIIPLLLPLLLLFTLGLSQYKKELRYGLLSIFILSQSYLTLKLARHHQEKNALSQACEYVLSHSEDKDIISSNNLIAYYLGQFDTHEIMFLLPSDLPTTPEGRIITIGEVLPDKELIEEKNFYHNPYVNRMWYEVVVRIYK